MAKGLIVDDSKFMRKIIRDALEEEGFEIAGEADNGSDGVEYYKKCKPDFVTMDITMGGKDGLRAVKEIIEFDPGAKVVVVSALNERTLRMNEPNINPSAFITKPFAKRELVDVIKKVTS